MNINKTWWVIICFLTLMVACTKDNSSDSTTTQSEETQDYTATTEVKTAILEWGYCSRGTYGDFSEGGKLCCIYKDYSRKYYLSIYEGRIRIWVLTRPAGSWNSVDQYFEITNSTLHAGMIDVNIKSTLSEITEKPTRVWNNHFQTTYQDFRPNHGYSVCFTTENEEELFMRILATNYTLDEDESLKSVTIQYQLF